MNLLALDYGTRRVGVAGGDTQICLATPLPFLSAQPWPEFLEALKRIIAARRIEKILIGLPLRMDGSEGTAAQAARAFGEKVGAATGLPVEFSDERLSSVEAHQRLREAGRDARSARTRVDSAAAAILLQDYLNALEPPGTREAPET